MKELERTYLAKYLPEGLTRCESKEMLDIYIPSTTLHPTLRIRRNGIHFEITKKAPIDTTDASINNEATIELTQEEFTELSNIAGKRVYKIRYLYPWEDKTAEFDVFQDALAGLVLVDFEFGSEVEKDSFTPPDFCLAEVTQEENIAGGFLAGKSYEDIKSFLKRYNYRKQDSQL